ncbi:DUF493 domain-containing protein [Bermanella marisrubri]|uniref:UPF0250 protein RED65_08084 n=1 Tax=Bermanella marisrubri TaxID=207949 RepID=Q1N085_9GAMM|nr:DUF493 domain-containing protein [Bermanella marisrubri]EAT11632.1 hypothetical protein RED65_08084 [Oceanobacter sp. RED65] [Bermanella marisrubri]QIZ83326.1 DUF493 domain-containing protein [Bermanella marisrubri]
MAKKADPAKIEFPCPDYPVKILGEGGDDYQQIVTEIVEIHAPGFDAERIKINHSSKGRFTSLTLFITAQSPEQLKQLHEDLMKHERIKMVL